MHKTFALFSLTILNIIEGAGAFLINPIVALLDITHIICASPHANDIFATHNTKSFSSMPTLSFATL